MQLKGNFELSLFLTSVLGFTLPDVAMKVLKSLALILVRNNAHGLRNQAFPCSSAFCSLKISNKRFYYYTYTYYDHNDVSSCSDPGWQVSVMPVMYLGTSFVPSLGCSCEAWFENGTNRPTEAYFNLQRKDKLLFLCLCN